MTKLECFELLEQAKATDTIWAVIWDEDYEVWFVDCWRYGMNGLHVQAENESLVTAIENAWGGLQSLAAQ
jgi:hypothetical protein